ncbi:MAG: DNA cytosine methyltransferase, partial [Miltoncostaeaceae bacterium]
MKVLSLFTGIGGVELGLERTGMFKPMAFVERDPFCQKVLARHWPEVTIFDDVEKMPAACPDPPDVITAGFPCQPVSHAGRRLAQKDERWMWPHVERCVRVLRPQGVLLENVPGLLTAGFNDVIGGLATCGYDAEWDCIPAAAVGAPHLRE